MNLPTYPPFKGTFLPGEGHASGKGQLQNHGYKVEAQIGLAESTLGFRA